MSYERCTCLWEEVEHGGLDPISGDEVPVTTKIERMTPDLNCPYHGWVFNQKVDRMLSAAYMREQQAAILGADDAE